MRGSRTRLRIGLVLLPVALVFLVIAGANAFGKPKSSAAQAQYKVTICHKTGSVKNPSVTIRVSSRAATAHVNRHGDTLGPCQAPTAPTTASSEEGSQSNGKGKAKGKDK